MVKTAIWHNPRVRSLSDSSKLLWLYVITSPHTNSCGAFVLPPGYVMGDLGWSLESTERGFNDLVQSGLIGCDRKANLIWIVGWFEHNAISNQSYATGTVEAFDRLPDCKGKSDWFVVMRQSGGRFLAEALAAFYAKKQQNDKNQQIQLFDPVFDGKKACLDTPADIERDIEAEKERQKEQNILAASPPRSYGQNKIKAGLGFDDLTEDQVFETTFWAHYPRAVNRKVAFESWRRAVIGTDKRKPKIGIAELERLTRAYFKSVAAKIGTDDEKFLPHPATWMNQERWSNAISKREKKPGYVPMGVGG